MKTLGYYNGKYDELENMSVPMNDRVCWFGDGVYDAGPCRNYKIFAIDEHVDRFFISATPDVNPKFPSICHTGFPFFIVSPPPEPQYY